MSNKLNPGDRVTVDAGLGITKTGNVQRITESTVFVKHYNGAVVGYRTQHVTKMFSEQAAVKPRGVGLKSEFDAFMQVMEKKLTPAELKKREEVAKAMERENPGMPMDKKMAIATATAKKVAEEAEQIEEAMTADEKKTAREVHRVLNSGESTSQTYGTQIKFKHSELKRKHGSDWRKKAGINEEAEQIDEISKKTAMSYLTKAGKELDTGSKTPEKRDKRIDGYFAAGKRLAGEKPTSEEKAHTAPKTAKEKDLAAMAHPKDKITHADVMVGRGVKKEETEQIDELSKDTLSRYAGKARSDINTNLAMAGDKSTSAGKSKEMYDKVRQRAAGMKTADRKMKEDVHYCAKHVFSERFGEGMVVEGQHAEPNEQGLIEWYDVDFGGQVRRVMTEKVKVMHAEYHMNHKKMKEEDEVEDEDEDDKKEMKEMSSKEKMKRGLYNKEEAGVDEELKGNQHKIDKNKNGKIDAHDFKLLRKEDAEQIDELNKDTLTSYQDKADADIMRKHRVLGPQIKAGDAKAANKTAGTIQKRMTGIDRAVDRLNKEEVDQIDELSSGLKSRYKQAASRSMDQAQDFKSELDREGVSKKSDVRKDVNRIISNRKAGMKRASEEVDLDEKLTDDAKKKIQTALGPKFPNNTLRKDSGPARAIIGLAKTNPNNIVKKEEVDLDEARNVGYHHKGSVIWHDDLADHKERHQTILRLHKNLTKLGYSTKNKEHLNIAHHEKTKNNIRFDNKDVTYTHPSKPSKTVQYWTDHPNRQGKRTHVVQVINTPKKANLPESVGLNEAMISYSDFQSKIAAHQKAGNQIKDDKYDKKKASYTVIDKEGTAKKITHTDSGVSQQHLGSVKRKDDDESSETKPTQTRGRGRPAGSKSGARN